MKTGPFLVDNTANIDGKKVKVTHHLFTWSNLISFSRVFVAFPICYLHYTGGNAATWPIITLIVYGLLSDYLDGYLARRLDEVSEWGKVLDPVADKLSAFVLFFYTVYMGLVPLWFFLVEVVRDAIILAGSTYLKVKRGKVAMAVMSGKWSVNALAAYWLTAFFFPEQKEVQLFFMGISLCLMFFSLIDYFYRFNEIHQGYDFN